jgi:hypothetical protein
VIGGGRQEHVGVLSISHQIAWTRIGAAVARTLGLWSALDGLCSGYAGGRQETAGSGRCKHVTTRDGFHDFLSLALRAMMHQDTAAEMRRASRRVYWTMVSPIPWDRLIRIKEETVAELESLSARRAPDRLS